MRTKTLLIAAAAIAAGVLSSQAASNVYSANVVGYVNVVVEGGGTYSLLSNPLNNTTDNHLVNVFSTTAGNQQPSSQVLTWDVVAFDFDVTQPSFVAGSWTANVNLPPGKGFFYVNNGDTFTNTFVGEVVQGTFSNLLVNGSYNCVGASVPQGGSFTNAIAGLVPGPSDQLLVWDKLAFDFNATQPSFVAGSWTATVNVGVGEGFFYVNNNGDNTWVRNFTVQ
jgi:hypothetical protein